MKKLGFDNVSCIGVGYCRESDCGESIFGYSSHWTPNYRYVIKSIKITIMSMSNSNNAEITAIT